jgi:hypothetical protein
MGLARQKAVSMSNERLSMRKVKEVLRLKWACGLSNRQIGRSCNISKTAVSEYLGCAHDVNGGLEFPRSGGQFSPVHGGGNSPP